MQKEKRKLFRKLRQEPGLSAGSRQRWGKHFEHLFQSMGEHMCRAVVERIPDGCRAIGIKVSIRIKSPFDFIVKLGDRYLFCDAKSTAGKRLPVDKIKIHQVAALERLHSDRGRSGYVVNFRGVQEIRWLSVELLKSALAERRGINHEEGLLIGGTEPNELNLGKIYGDVDTLYEAGEAA